MIYYIFSNLSRLFVNNTATNANNILSLLQSYEIPLYNNFSGEQDDRVFTLAEQIIAAMPERIKVRFIKVYRF